MEPEQALELAWGRQFEPDWVLIYRVDEEEGILRLYRMGSHAELELG